MLSVSYCKNVNKFTKCKKKSKNRGKSLLKFARIVSLQEEKGEKIYKLHNIILT